MSQSSTQLLTLVARTDTPGADDPTTDVRVEVITEADGAPFVRLTVGDAIDGSAALTAPQAAAVTAALSYATFLANRPLS